MKLYKEIVKENGKLQIYGSNKWIKIDYAVPDWSTEEEPYFRFRNNRYYLSEFMLTRKDSDFSEFEGYMSDSFFSGVLIKVDDNGEAVKAYLYMS